MYLPMSIEVCLKLTGMQIQTHLKLLHFSYLVIKSGFRVEQPGAVCGGILFWLSMAERSWA